jgi:hypothetical protein
MLLNDLSFDLVAQYVVDVDDNFMRAQSLESERPHPSTQLALPVPL